MECVLLTYIPTNPTPYSTQLLRTEKDRLGNLHQRYTQTWNGIPVEGGQYILHMKNGQVYAANGHYYEVSGDFEVRPTVNEAVALQSALDHVGAAQYKWQVAEEEAWLKARSQDPEYTGPTTFYPTGELVMAPTNGDFASGKFRLAWKYDIYAHQPIGRTYTYVDAHTGEVIWQWERMHTADTEGTAVTRYSGEQTITADSFEGGFRLRESGRGDGIRTFNLRNGTNYNQAADFVDDDNTWNNANANLDEVATDAHWGAEMTYDFFQQSYGRNSIDGEGFALESYVHYGQNFANAFWDGLRMTYGDGDGNDFPPLTSLDIAAHEIVHGLTQFSADLIYQNESGALNESFSDIFAKAVESYARPNQFSWRLGEDLGAIIRNMEDPNEQGDPKLYEGSGWITNQNIDNGGVHINSGVQNHWYYLLVEGKEDVNELGNPYQVEGLGFEKASAIAYRTLTNYLTPSSQFEDAQFFSIQSAIDLYGECTPEHAAVTNAWYAVGLGQPFSVTPVSDFSALGTVLCSEPYEVAFRNLSLGGENYQWNFGDGGLSSDNNPTHIYEAPGTYTVSLEIDGICGGGDTKTVNSFIQIDPAPTPPIAQTTTVACRESALLEATGSGQISWFNADGQLVGEGEQFQTPILNESITYFARNQEVGTEESVGPPDGNTFGTGGYHNTEFESRIHFTVQRSLRVLSVLVDAGSAGDREVVLEDGTGNTLRTFSVFIPEGPSRVAFNLDLEPGNYRIGGSFMDLYRNDTGTQYPYDIPGLITLTGAPIEAGTDFFYYFYDWEVAPICSSEQIPVTANVNALEVPQIADATRCGAGVITFIPEDTSQTYNWYNVDGEFLASGATFTTPELTESVSYLVESEISGDPMAVGPETPEEVGPGSYHETGFDARLQFEVLKPIRLKSVWVDAGAPGERTIVLEDGNSNLLQTLTREIPEGQGRLELNLDLQPGRYAMGGTFMNLYRNNDGAVYPYTLDSLVNITGSNATTSETFYYYFYDWEVVEAPCFSERTLVNAVVQVGEGPSPNFSFEANDLSVVFTDASNNASSWVWSFGDGATSTDQNPVHVYADTGTYEVQLVVSDGICQEVISQTVTVTQTTTSLTPALEGGEIRVFPNPGRGPLSVEVDLDRIEPVSVKVLDLMGRQLALQGTQQTHTARFEVDLTSYSPGTYLIRVEVDTQVFTYKYLLQK